MAPLYSSLPVRYGSATVSKHEQYQDLETEAAAWKTIIIHFISDTKACLLKHNWITVSAVKKLLLHFHIVISSLGLERN